MAKEVLLWDLLDLHAQGEYWEDLSVREAKYLPKSISKLLRKGTHQAWLKVGETGFTAIAEVQEMGGRSYLRFANMDVDYSKWTSRPLKFLPQWELNEFYGNKSSCAESCSLSHIASA